MKNSLFFAVWIAIFSGSAWAASVTWNDSGTDFNDGSSWGGGSAPGSGDNAVFSGPSTNQPGLTDDATIQGVTWNGADASGYTLSAQSGKSLTLTNSGSGANSAINAENTSGTNTISAPIILGGAAGSTVNFTQAAGGTLHISGSVSSANAINGINLAGGNGRIFTFSGANSYAGNTSVNGNTGVTLNINHASAISSGALDLGVGLTIDNTSGAAITLANNNNINLRGGSLTFTGSNDLSFGSGIVTVSGSNRTVTVSGGNLTIGSIDADNTTRTFTKAGSGGALIITGAAGANFQGGFINTGSLVLGNKSALGTGLLTITGGSTLNASTNLTGANAIANRVALNANLAIGGDKDIELSGDITLNGCRTLTNSNTGNTKLSGAIFLSDAAGSGRTLTVAGGQSLVISGAIANYDGSGTSGNLSVLNTAIVSLTNANSSYTGTTKLQGSAGAILEVTKLADGGVNSSIGASSNATANLLLPNLSTLRYVGAGDSTDRLFSIAGTNDGHKTTLDASGTGAIHFTNTGSLAYGTINRTRGLTLSGTNTGDNSLAAAIENNGTGATTVEKDGTGRWILKGTNTYTGKTNVNAGTLQFGQRVSLYNANTSYWATSNITVASGATLAFNVGGTGEFTSSDITHFTAMGSATSGYVSGSFMGLDTTNASGGVFTHSGVISNPNSGSNVLGLKKLGTGTLELTGDNTYTGATTVTAGTLLIQGAHSGAGAVTVQSGAAIGGGGSVAGNLTLDAGANFVFSLTDTLTVNGASVSFGGFGISNVLGLDGSVAVGTYTLIDGSATFDFDNVSNWGVSNAVAIGGGKSAYFQEGSLQVVVIPEPGVVGLLLLGGAMGFAFRRRQRTL